MSLIDRLRDDFNAIRNVIEYVKNGDYKDIVPLMPTKDQELVDKLLYDWKVDEARALVRVFKSKLIDYMPIMELRSKAQSLGIKNFKTLPPETLRKIVNATLNQTVQQTPESDS